MAEDDVRIDHDRALPTSGDYGQPHLFHVLQGDERLFSVQVRVSNSAAATLDAPSGIGDLDRAIQSALAAQGDELVRRVFVEDSARFEEAVAEGGDEDLLISTYEHTDWLEGALRQRAG